MKASLRSAALLLLLSSACEQRLSYGSLALDAAALTDGIDAGAGCAPAPLSNVACEQTALRFAYALCSCADVQASAPLLVDGFDSELAAYSPGGPGSLGVNGALYPLDAVIGGTLIVAGDNGAPLGGALSVGEDLFSAGQLDGAFAVDVGRNVHVLGNLHVQSLRLAGQLHVAAGTSVEIAEGAPPFARDAQRPVRPCDCTPALDVAALVATARMDNDDLAVGLAPESGLSALEGPLELTLPCGRFYVDRIYAAHPITITVTGRAELHVAGGIVADAAGTLEVQLAPGGELDLLVAGSVSTQNHVSIGSRATPGRTRIHGSAGQTFYFGGETVLSALLDAPESSLVTAGPFEAFGALLVQSSSSSEPVRIHHDRAVTRCAP